MKYYFIDQQGNQSAAPVDETLLTAYGVTPKTFVWCEGMTDWKQADSIPSLAIYFTDKAPLPTVEPPVGTGRHAPSYNSAVKPDSYLWLGILTTILCCLPFGIVSIVYASKVDSLWFAGYHDEARANSEKAKNWGIAAFVTSLVVGFIYICILISAGNL